jgi:hypothetical protein
VRSRGRVSWNPTRRATPGRIEPGEKPWALGVESLEDGVDVVAERQPELRGSGDGPRYPGQRDHGDERADDLIGGGSRGERVLDGVLVAGLARIDRDLLRRTSAWVLASKPDSSRDASSARIAATNASSRRASLRSRSLYSST